MAYATDPIDLNRGSQNLTVPTELSNEVIQMTAKKSAVMQLAPQITLPGRGASIPVILGDAMASIVAESTEKPVGNATVMTKTMVPYTFALIEVFSNEFKRDLGALYDALADRLPNSIAMAFDNAVIHGPSTPLTGFDDLSNATRITRAAADTITDVTRAGFTTVAAQGLRVNGLAVSPAYGTELILADDNNGRPLFLPTANDGGPVGKVYGADVAETIEVGTMVGGDWSTTRWGMVNDIEIAISDQATVNNGTEQINLWQRNCFALRVECQLGFVHLGDSAFFQVVTA